MIEVLLVIAGISAIGAVGYVATSNAKATAESVKLESDVKSINQAIDLYRANGGQIAANSTADALLAKLKTRADSASGGTTIGLKSSFLDVRTEAEWQSSSEATTSQLRAVWDPVAMAFSTSTGTTLGIKRFRINNTLASAAPVTESRNPTLQGAASGWVWDHAVAEAVTATSGISPSLAALLSHEHLTGGAFIVGSSGTVVTDNKVYDGAGYRPELGIFSLEGMGNDVYNLTTAAGILAFMREAVRRVAEGGALGGVAMDRDGGGRTLNFAAGTAVAFVIIPNDTFAAHASVTESTWTMNGNINITYQGAETFMNGINPSSNDVRYPLTSLSFNTGDVTGFSQSQAVSLGNEVFAFEDIPGGGDADFEDIIFKTTGLTQPSWSTMQQVTASSYYSEAKLNQLGDSILGAQQQTLRQALQGVNVLP